MLLIKTVLQVLKRILFPDDYSNYSKFTGYMYYILLLELKSVEYLVIFYRFSFQIFFTCLSQIGIGGLQYLTFFAWFSFA